MIDWRDLTLDQLGRIVTGKTPPTADSENYGGAIPFVTPSDMDGRRAISDTARYLTATGLRAVANAKIPCRSVMVSCIGSDMGKAAIAGSDCVTNQQINSIIVNHEFEPLFVYYNLSMRKEEIRNAASGCAQPIMNKSTFSRLRISIPDKARQIAIASVLGALDDKIELNRRMNETLEAMARAIFKDWFVDFGPTRAKMEGRAPYLVPEIWSLFPDQLDEEGSPEGWRTEPLDEIAVFLNGLALQKYPARESGFLPVIKISQLRAGHVENSDQASTDIPSDYIVENGDVLFSWSGSLLHRVWTAGRGALNQHLFKVTSVKYPKWFIFHWIGQHMPDFQATAASKATTMGHIQRLHLTRASTVVADPAIMAAADDLIAPLFNRTIANDLESRTLAATRDLLLPKLMSGEIRVRDAEKIVGEVA